MKQINELTNEEKDKLLKEARRENKKLYPVVMKSKQGSLIVIYENRREVYKKQSQDSITDLETGEFLPYDEIKMAKDNGFKRVKDTTNADDWRFEDD